MRYLVSYDIADNRRRARLADELLNYGPCLQESLFLADTSEARLDEMRREIDQLIDPLQDSVLLFPLCDACWRKVEVKGLAVLPEPQSFYVL
jgi:CRISPR-associated protein Cas2